MSSMVEENLSSPSITQTIANDWVESKYYNAAENYLHPFWDEGTIFYDRFKQLDTKNILELACGHGRHLTKYYRLDINIILMDILQENIDFCKNRFSAHSNIRYIKNNGNDFPEVETESISSILCYDAMVHFDLIDVALYLRAAHKILQKGGRLLFHHSNNAGVPGQLYTKRPHSRNFMSADIFSHLAITSGFKILSQNIFNWGDCYNLDCLSLCEK